MADSRPDLQRRSDDTKRSSVRRAIRSELASDAPDERTNGGGAARRRAKSHAVVALHNVSLAFDEPVLEDVSFSVLPGETVAVVGESGTGKSTILKLMLRLLVPDSGQVCIDGQDITGLSFDEALAVRQKMGMVFQGAALFDSMTVFENVAYPVREHTDLSEEEIEQRVREKLQFVDLDPERVMEQFPAELSGGMRKRVGLARAIVGEPQILLYDEPVTGLDPVNAVAVDRLITDIAERTHVTSIVVTHDVEGALSISDRVSLLEGGRLRFLGTPDEFRRSDDPLVRAFADRQAAVEAALAGSARSSRIADAKTPALP